MPVDIDVPALQQELASARAELERWAANLASEASAAKDAHCDKLERANGTRARNTRMHEARVGALAVALSAGRVRAAARAGQYEQLVQREQALSRQAEALAERAWRRGAARVAPRAAALRGGQTPLRRRRRQQRRGAAARRVLRAERCAAAAAPRRAGRRGGRARAARGGGAAGAAHARAALCARTSACFRGRLRSRGVAAARRGRRWRRRRRCRTRSPACLLTWLPRAR
jgi:hypothetical protein